MKHIHQGNGNIVILVRAFRGGLY